MDKFKKYKLGTGQQLYQKAKKIVPGGSQLFSKKQELYSPNIWPSYFKKAKGVHLTDMDNNTLLDMSTMGIGANILGYADTYVDNAVIQCIKNGSSSSLNSYEEIDLAELLIKMHPWSGMVRFCRSGGEAVSIAIRIARAHTGKDLILFNGYHGWHDWYLSANISSSNNLDDQLMKGLDAKGVPRSLSKTALPFNMEDIDAFEKLIKKNQKDLAAIIIEPCRADYPSKELLIQIQSICNKYGIILIFDEITSGFRLFPGGAHLLHKEIKPDIAIFAKSISNGYPFATIIGSKKIMQSGSETFISSTSWTERIGSVAAKATIEKYIKHSVHKKIIKTGDSLKKIWHNSGHKYSLDLQVSGLPSLPSFSFNNKDNLLMMSYYTARMLDFNILGFRQFKPSFSHNKNHLNEYKKAVDIIFEEIGSDKYKNVGLESQLAFFQRLSKE